MRDRQNIVIAINIKEM